MIRGENKRKRQEFCKLAIKNKEEAVRRLKSLADGLEGCRNISDITFALSEIFCVSERTIFNDYLHD